MPSFNAITFERYGNKRWTRRTSFGFTASETIAPLVAEELSSAVLAMPIAFIPTDEGFTIAAVMGLTQGQNLFISDEGHWIGHYIPASFRTNPFYLLPDESGRLLLCIDEDSGLVSDGSNGENFFNDAGEASESINDIMSLLSKIDGSRHITNAACQILAKYDLIQQWTITIDEAAGEKRIEGLYRIDETKLNALSPEEFLSIREAGALPIVYGQLFSMKNLKALGDLYSRRIEADAKSIEKSSGIGDTFSFS